MNLVLDEAEEVQMKSKNRKSLGEMMMNASLMFSLQMPIVSVNNM